MRIPTVRTQRDMSIAAELRAAGATWQTIAVQLGRHLTVVLRWPATFCEEWQRLLQEAEQRQARQGEATRAALRKLLRCRSPKVHQAVAAKLANVRRDELAAAAVPDPRVDPDAFVARAGELADKELHHWLNLLVEQIRSTSVTTGGERR